jgi:hypothetical protein
MVQQVVLEKNEIDASVIYAMRRSGATLQQIASRAGKTKERIRQILVQHYGSTKHKLMSTEQLRKYLGFSRYRVVELYNDNVIAPAREWETSGGRHLLLFPDTVEQITRYLSSHKLCKVCGNPIPVGRRVYCSEECYKEGHKYKYMSVAAKKRHLRNIRRYRDKRQVSV